MDWELDSRWGMRTLSGKSRKEREADKKDPDPARESCGCEE